MQKVWIALLLAATSGFAADLLQNRGFEIEGVSGQASNWWYYAAAGRATWAHRTGGAGNAFYAAGNQCGGFGQDVYVDASRGDVFRFEISGKAEINYTNPATTMGMEFWAATGMCYAVTTTVYSALASNRNEWVFLSLVHTAECAGLEKVIVRCDFADGRIAATQRVATCQWDDARFYQMVERSSTPPNYGKYEPLHGVYLGVLLEQGGTADEIAEFNQKAGKTHAVYAKFVVFKKDPFPQEWVEMIKSNYPGAAVHLILEPMVDFEDFYAPDWGPGQETYDAALAFATNCARAALPIFLRFAHEANGDWYPWHPSYSEKMGITDTVSNESYIAAFRNFADLVHSNAPNVALVWAPNQGNGPEPMPYYEDVYPGDEYVDWVGLSVYNGWSYGNSNDVLDYQFRNAVQKGYWQENDNPYDDTFEDFYWMFSDPDNPEGHHKPMMIAETAAAFEPKYSVTSTIIIAGFESLDGPDFVSSNLLAQFQSLNSDGWVSSNRTWVEGFEDIATWNWGPWGTNGCTWSNTSDAAEGTAALVMSGSPEAGGTYVGGNGRGVGSVPFDEVKTIADFQDLNSDGLTISNETWIDDFDWKERWNWGPWGEVYFSNAADYVQGTNACVLGAMDSFSNGAYVGGTGRNGWQQYFHFPVLYLADFENVWGDGLWTTNHVAIDDFEDTTPWNWCWGNLAWSNTSDAAEGTNAATLGGDPNPGETYVGGNGRYLSGCTNWSGNNGLELWVKSVPGSNAEPILRIGIRSLTNDATYEASVERTLHASGYYPLHVYFDEMEVSNGFSWSNIVAVTLELSASVPGESPGYVCVDAWDLVDLTNADYIARDWWPRGTNLVPLVDPEDNLGGTHVWEVVEDSWGEPFASNSFMLTGTDPNGNGYIGGDGFDLAEEERDWSDGREIYFVARRGEGTNVDPILQVELEDGNGYTAVVSHVLSSTYYSKRYMYFSNAVVEAGFDWGDVRSLKLNMLTASNGLTPAPIYIQRLEVKHRSPGADLSYFSGMGLWVHRDEGTNCDPVLKIGLRSPDGGTATIEKVVTGTDWYPVRWRFSEMSLNGSFTFTNVTGYTVELCTSHSNQAPAAVSLDRFFAALVSAAPAHDQDWWPLGPEAIPWKDGSDPQGTQVWRLVEDVYTGYPPKALLMTGTDSNANNYCGGDGCQFRPCDMDWSAGTHVALLLRRAADQEHEDPMLMLDIIDGDGHTATVTHVVGGTSYEWALLSYSNMDVQAGFAWTNVTSLKLHMLTKTAGRDPAGLYIKAFRLATVPHETPRDWSAFNGMELTVKHAPGGGALPMLGITVRSEADGITGTASVQRVVSESSYYVLRIPFSEMEVTPGFTWSNVSALVLELLTTESNTTPAALYVDDWHLVNLSPAAYRDQDWWPAGSNDNPWTDATDTNGGWHSWSLVSDPYAGYPSNALKMSGFDANSNYYIGGNGFSLRAGDRDWEGLTHIALLARRSTADTNFAEPLLAISLVDGGSQTARISQVITPTNYVDLLLDFTYMEVDEGFQWSNVQSVIFELLSGTPGRQPADVYLKQFRIGTVSNRFEQDWWKEGEDLEPWGDITWTQTSDSAAGEYALLISGVVTNSEQWYIGGNGCSLAIPEQNWTNSNAIVLYAKRGHANRPDPKIRITVDNDYSETNGNEAYVMTRLANSNYTEIIIPFSAFDMAQDFEWDSIRMLKLEMFTNRGGDTPNDIYIDQLRRARVTLTNGEDNLRWKRDWYDQLYSLSDYADADPADPDAHPDYVSISRCFRNIHMINWFHVRKFEDGFTKDLRIVEEGTGTVAYTSYYDHIRDSYFLTNVIRDTDCDGMPDDWETQNFGGPTNADACADSDGDGLGNLQEYIAGTDPCDVGSAFEIASGGAASGPGGITIQWASVAGRVYTLSRTTNLLAGFCSYVTNIAATPPTNYHTDSSTAGDPVFYRIQVLP